MNGGEIEKKTVCGEGGKLKLVCTYSLVCMSSAQVDCIFFKYKMIIVCGMGRIKTETKK